MTTERETLEERHAPIEMTTAEFRSAGHRLVDQIADWLNGVPAGPVTHDESAADVRRALNADRGLPSVGKEAGTLLEETADLLFAHSLFNGHPRFFGYITSSPAPIGVLGDFLASAVNQNVGAWKLAPLATEIEAQAVRWIAELIGFSADGGGLLVSGGNMANFVGFLAARTAKATWDVRKAGLGCKEQRLRVYASTETHTWIQKAADLFGLGTDAIRWIQTDDQQRMDPSALEMAIQNDLGSGELPFLVVGTAGSVGTGVVDPLPAIAAICRKHRVWFHVDGAYGALAAGVPGAPDSLRGLSEADSVAVDPHKWLYTPLEAGCVLVRRAEDLRRTFSYHPSYYHFDHDVINYFDYGPQNSRGFRALKVWLAFGHTGSAGCRQMIEDDMKLSRHLHEILGDHPDFEPMTQSLSINTFRYVPSDVRSSRGSADVEAYLNRLNQDLLSRVERSGEAFLSSAVVRDTFALRACIVNFRTSLSDIDALPSILVRLGKESDAAIRSAVGPGVGIGPGEVDRM